MPNSNADEEKEESEAPNPFTSPTASADFIDNDLSAEAGKQALRDLLGATNVAILPPDDEVLAHSDGMVSWLDVNTLLVNDYSNDPSLRKEVMQELSRALARTSVQPASGEARDPLPMIAPGPGLDPDDE